jgi:small subunit ribosomal protein S20
VSNSSQGSKVARTAARRRLRNRLVRSRVKTYVAKAEGSARAGEDAKQEKAKQAISSIDRAVGKGIIHRNKAARLKSRLARRVNKGE